MPLTYTIGDIHGRDDLLAVLLASIDRHSAGRPRQLVFLGDYIDGGPSSCAVIARLRALENAQRDAVICLAGNHEDLLLRSLTNARDEAAWMTTGGGSATLASYGVTHVTELPLDVIDWLRDLRTLHADDLRYYVHAGLRPGQPIEPEDRGARLWIREAFLDGEHDFGRLVVHGHTARRDGVPDVRMRRINLDTAVRYGGRLTAGVFAEDVTLPIAYLQVTQDGALLSADRASDLPRIPAR